MGEIVANQYIRFISNLTANSIRREKLEGADCIVVPVAMLSEGVYEGSGGPIFYPSYENNKSVPAWDHKPAVIYHPEIAGQGVSAAKPEILNTRKVGMLLETNNDSKLRSFVWFNEKRLKEVDDRVLNAIEKGEPVEVSTGLYMDLEYTEGIYNGKRYTAIAHNYRPDHLAILPDKIGAYSVQDGGGLAVTNERTSWDDGIQNREFSADKRKAMAAKGEALPDGSYPIATVGDLKNAIQAFGRAKNKGAAKRHIIKRAKALGKTDLLPEGWVKNEALTNNELSYAAICAQLCSLLYDKFSEPGLMWTGWIMDVYDDYFIYVMGSDYYRQDYSVDNNTVSLDGKPEEVVRVVEYQVANSGADNVSTNEDKNMDRSKLINAMIANSAATGWEETDRQHLEKMPDEKFKKITKGYSVNEKGDFIMNPPVPTQTPNPTPAPAIVANTQNTQTAPAVPSPTPPSAKPITEEEYVANAPPGIRALLQQGLQAAKEEKERLVDVIMNAKGNMFTKEFLQGKSDINELRGMAALVGGPVDSSSPQMFQPSFVGNAGASLGRPGQKVTQSDLPIPTVNQLFGKEKPAGQA